MWRYLAAPALFIVLLGFFLVGLFRDPTLVPSPLINQPAPQFELPQLLDPERTLALSDLATGEPVLLNVWATWCVGCRQEHGMLVDISRSGEIPIFGLNWKDDRTAALRWLERLGDPYVAVAVDDDGRVAIDWGVYGSPETFLLDGQGIIRYKHIGPIDQAVWEREFRPRIAQLRQGDS
ncbi:MAG: DsbE family thiol:disulfide interchange protein [Gammaproteobacteria bacterium]|nr:MAG: DsbE family thiol:disulfide interchange protein [Gammaproteobacteria bacterium]